MNELGGFQEVVGVVGIAHDDVSATGGGDAAHEGVAITLVGDGDYACAKLLRDLGRTIVRAVVGDDDFAGDVGFS